MSNFYVHFPMCHIVEEKLSLEVLLRNKINPELGLDAIALDYVNKSWHKELAMILKDNGKTCAMHLPFHDLQPGSIDDFILFATRERLKRSLEIAAIYQPHYLVAHDYFINLYNEFFSRWLNRSVVTWTQVLREWSSSIPLYLENVRESDPHPVSDLLNELKDYNVRFCFDLGHWFSYGKGSQLKNLALWIQVMSPYIAHLHLHDNDGIEDQHLGLGLGNIPWIELFAGLDFLDLTPGFTLEVKNLEDLEYSYRFIQKHISWFSRLGIRKKHFGDNLEYNSIPSNNCHLSSN